MHVEIFHSEAVFYQVEKRETKVKITIQLPLRHLRVTMARKLGINIYDGKGGWVVRERRVMALAEGPLKSLLS